MVVSKIQKFAQLNKNNEKRDYKQSNAVDILKNNGKRIHSVALGNDRDRVLNEKHP